MGNANILKAINATNPVIFLVHGYIDMRATPWYFALTDALLNKSDCNVIQVDWSVLAHADYVTAAKNVGIIGKFFSTGGRREESNIYGISQTLIHYHNLQQNVTPRNIDHRVQYS